MIILFLGQPRRQRLRRVRWRALSVCLFWQARLRVGRALLGRPMGLTLRRTRVPRASMLR
jgi:hypothetical protein